MLYPSRAWVRVSGSAVVEPRRVAGLPILSGALDLHRLRPGLAAAPRTPRLVALALSSLGISDFLHVAYKTAEEKVSDPLAGAVVVITGASSGFGRAAALAFARAGARVSLAARGRDALEDTAHACRRLGAEVLVVAADVGDAAAVEQLANRTVERFGRIDVWVNNAGVILYGRFEDSPAEGFERVVRTNLLGQVHGARAALRQFRKGCRPGSLPLARCRFCRWPGWA